jgi:molybdate transport system substrate-binding protein
VLKVPKILALLLLTGTLMPAGAGAQTRGAEITVMSSGAFYSTLEVLIPIYEQKSGNKVVLISGSSMGASPTAIPTRLKRGEAADLLFMAGPELDKLIEENLAVPGSRVDLVQSKIGMVVRAGAPKPDISTTDALIRTLLAAKSIGYSASASGTYLEEVLFPQLGIYDQIKDKAKKIIKDRVATWVARGDMEIGFQQVSELLPVPGVDFVGVLPDGAQKVTVFSVGTVNGAGQVKTAEDFVQFLISSDVRPIIEKQGLEPIH